MLDVLIMYIFFNNLTEFTKILNLNKNNDSTFFDLKHFIIDRQIPA